MRHKPLRLQLPDGRVLTRQTDEKGKVTFSFRTTHYQSGTYLAFRADLTAENVAVESRVLLAALGFAIRIKPPMKAPMAGKPIDVLVETRTPDGEPIGKQLTLTVLRSQPATRTSLLDQIPWLASPQQTAETEISQHFLTTEAQTGRAIQTLNLVEAGSYTFRITGMDRFGQVVSSDAYLQVVDDRNEAALKLVTESLHLAVGDAPDIRIHSRLESLLALVTVETEGVLSYRLLPLEPGETPLPFKVEHAHYPNFRIGLSAIGTEPQASHERPIVAESDPFWMEPTPPRFHVDTTNFTVERELKVSVLPDKEVYRPGEEAQIRLQALDHQGLPVRSELSLALVDEALFALFAEGRSLTEFVREAVLHRPEGRTASTCGFHYRPMVRKVVREWAEEVQRLQQQAEFSGQAKASLLRIVNPDTGKRFGVMVFNDEIVDVETLRQRLKALPDELRYLLLIEPDDQVSVEQLTLVAEISRQAGVNNVEYVMPGTRRKALPKPRKPVVRPIGKPVVPTEGFDLLESGVARVQPRMTTAAVVRPANVRAATVLEFSNQQVKMTPPVDERGGVIVRDDTFSANIWLPAVVTDSNGEAEVRFVMPQKTTRWRLTARGCTSDALLGEHQASVVTRADFFLSLKLPRTLVEGDQVQPLLLIHNLTPTEGAVSLRLTWRNGSDEGVLEQQVALAAHVTTQAIFEPIPAGTPGEMRVEIVAESHGNGTLKDALMQMIPVRPWGRELTDTRRGVATGDVNLSLQLLPESDLRNRKLTIRIAPEVERLVLDLALSASAGGADNQTAVLASQLLGVAHALEYAQLVTLPTADVNALILRAQSMVSALVVRQRTEGSWTWCPGASEADDTSTARCLWALAHVQQQGIAVPDAVMQNAVSYLRAAQPKNTNEDERPLLLYALARAGVEDLSSANRLYRNRSYLSHQALAMTALYFTQWERHPVAIELLESLTGQGKAEVLDAETLALTVLALITAQPESTHLPSLVEQLLSKRNHHRISVASGLTTAALASHYRQSRFVTNDYRLSISVNGRALQELQVRRGQELFTLETEEALEGENSVSLAVQGRARYAYEVTLSGFASDFPAVSPTPDSHLADTYRSALRRAYYHPPLEHDGRRIAQSTSRITQLEHGGLTSVQLRIPHTYLGQTVIVEEPLPAGTTLVPDSAVGGFHHFEITDAGLRFYYGQNQRERTRGAVRPGNVRLPGVLHIETIRYELGGYAPGDYRVPPTSLRTTSDPDAVIYSQATTLAVLKPGQLSTDEYVMNDEERFGLGKALFEDGQYGEALPLLAELHEHSPSHEQREVTRLLFWIRTEEDYHDARQIVETFESLQEHSPELVLPFDRVLAAQRAYQEMGESERAYRLLIAVLDASYANESHVSATLQDEGQLLNAMDFQETLWQTYPDTESVVTSYFGLSQALIAASGDTGGSPLPPRLPLLGTQDSSESGNTKAWLQPVMLLQRGTHLLLRFLNLYATDPLADDAAFSLANAYLDLGAHAQSIQLCRSAQLAYPDSTYQSGFQYVQALGFFWQHEFESAIQAALAVAQGDSDDRQLAQYILGQIHHAQGKTEEAIRWYRKVQDVYPDACESVEQFERRSLSMPQPASYAPGEQVSLTLKYRNIREAHIQIYRVDLMRFYLREKNLRDLSQIRLAGIEPLWSELVPLGDGRDYAEKQRTLPLEIKEEGTYLAVCRGDDLFASSVILITPLSMEVQADGSGRVRVSLRNALEEGHPEGVHVKVIGPGDDLFVSGETDLRGIFAADGIRGNPTVVARDSQNRYAFYRGDRQSRASTTSSGNRKKQSSYQPSQADYRKNLQQRNMQIRDAGIQRLRELQREARGIQIGR